MRGRDYPRRDGEFVMNLDKLFWVAFSECRPAGAGRFFICAGMCVYDRRWSTNELLTQSTLSYIIFDVMINGGVGCDASDNRLFNHSDTPDEF